MTFPDFDSFFDHLMEECRGMRDTKGKEYANSEADRFKNFKDIANELGLNPLEVCMIFADKHIRAVKSYIRTGQIHSTERIRGRFVDIITYFGLMAGIEEEMTMEREKSWESQARNEAIQKVAVEELTKPFTEQVENSLSNEALEKLRAAAGLFSLNDSMHYFQKNKRNPLYCGVCRKVKSDAIHIFVPEKPEVVEQ